MVGLGRQIVILQRQLVALLFTSAQNERMLVSVIQIKSLSFKQDVHTACFASSNMESLVYLIVQKMFPTKLS